MTLTALRLNSLVMNNSVHAFENYPLLGPQKLFNIFQKEII